MIIGVDPGKTFAAAAVHEDKELTCALYAPGDDPKDTAATLFAQLAHRYPAEILRGAEVAIERPQVYNQHLLKGDPNDLIDVTMMGAYFAKEFSSVVWYLPREWKGQMNKAMTKKLALAELSEEEIARIKLPSAKGLHHNVWDAVGITLHHARRVRVRGLRVK